MSTTDFDDALASNLKKTTHIVEIFLDSETRYYSTRSVASITGCLPYVTKAPSIPAQKIDIQKASTSISSASVMLIDKDGYISLDHSEDSYLNKKMNVYLMFHGLTFPTDAVRVFTGYIDSLDYSHPEITLRARELKAVTQSILFDTSNNLTNDIANNTLNIMVNDISVFQDAGKFRIDDEIISYTGRDTGTNTFTGVVRATNGSVAVAHEAGAEVLEVFESGLIDPIDLLLNLLLSVDGTLTNDPTYDVYYEGIGIDPDDLDLDSFEDIRDANLYGDFSFLISGGIQDTLKFIEEEILLPCLVRLVTSYDGKLTLKQIDQVDVGSTVPTIDDDSIIGTPKLSSNTRYVVNNVSIKYNYSLPVDDYSNILNSQDDVSIEQFGNPTNSKQVFEFKGMTDSTQAQTFADAYLARNSTPSPTISFKTFLSNKYLSPGDDIVLDSNNLINLDDGTTHFNSVVEIISIGQNGDELDFVCAFTRYTLGRSTFISPSEVITANASASTVLTVVDASLFKIGMAVQLQRNDNLAFETGSKLITDVDYALNEITIASAFSATIVNNVHTLNWADYNNAVSTPGINQKLWGYISDGSGDSLNYLNGSINSAVTTITLDDATDFAASGYVKIELETIQYTSKNATQLLGCTRGASSSTAASHADNKKVKQAFSDGAPFYTIKG